MKVRSINPGKVYPFKDGWAYTYILNGYIMKVETEAFHSANTAKQYMREKVAHERKRHGLGK
jgi:hypothetical protein